MAQSFFNTRLTTNFDDWLFSANFQRSAEREQRESFFSQIQSIGYFIGALFVVTFLLLILSRKQ